VYFLRDENGGCAWLPLDDAVHVNEPIVVGQVALEKVVRRQLLYGL
jgi:hypothetical protein